MPFETLDTTSRCLTRHGGEVLISDTVGFIRRFPERLLASFESTLAEIVEASLLVIVVDVSDHERELQLQTTLRAHREDGRGGHSAVLCVQQVGSPVLGSAAEDSSHVWQKVIRGQRSALETRGQWRDLEAGAAREQCAADEAELTTFVPYAASEILALVYGKCRVVDSAAESEGLTLRIQGPPSVIARIRTSVAVSVMKPTRRSLRCNHHALRPAAPVRRARAAPLAGARRADRSQRRRQIDAPRRSRGRSRGASRFA